MSNSGTNDFNTLKLKYNSACQSHHQILFKPHNVRVDEPSKPRERTLFCANIPPWATTEALKKIFQLNGNIENIYYQLQPSVGPAPLPVPDKQIFKPESSLDPYAVESGFKYAYIIFEKKQGVRNSMERMDLSKFYTAVSDDAPSEISGVKFWNKSYNELWINESKISEQIEEYMKDYDANVAENKRKNEELEEPDDEGWITVAKVDRRPKKKQGENNDDRSKNKKGRRKKKKLELQNFYSHQIKEEKLNKIQMLRKKFEQDKQKIAKMKSERKFRPF